ncbi:MAG: Hsp20/alpha crystallin family protein [Anaerolineae bacterium]|nr:Hsp20/alpha crystallin family protein [Anaerolineae bacterium]
MQEKKHDLPPEGGQASGQSWRVESYVVWRGSNRRFSPPTDVIELPDKLVVIVEIAGMRAGDFNVVLLDGRIVITGRRERPSREHAAFHQVEIGYGEFRSEVGLPWSIDRDQVSASYRDGFLQVELPRRAQVQIRVDQPNADDTKPQE